MATAALNRVLAKIAIEALDFFCPAMFAIDLPSESYCDRTPSAGSELVRGEGNEQSADSDPSYICSYLHAPIPMACKQASGPGYKLPMVRNDGK